MRHHFFLSNLLVAALVAGVGAIISRQDARQPIVFTERYLSSVPVSSRGVRVGLQALEVRSIIDAHHLFVRLPTTDLPRLCLSILSNDGRYEASAEYNTRQLRAGIVELQLPTIHQTALRRYGPTQVALLAGLSHSCAERIELFVVSQWARGAPLERAVLFLNSSDNSEVVFEGDRSSVRVACEKLTGETTAYNQRCVLNLTPTDSMLKATIQRRRYTTFLPSIKLDIGLP